MPGGISWTPTQGDRFQAEQDRLIELKRDQSSERPKKLEFAEQSTGEEEATKMKSFRNWHSGPLESLDEY